MVISHSPGKQKPKTKKSKIKNQKKKKKKTKQSITFQKIRDLVPKLALSLEVVKMRCKALANKQLRS
jgi:hypothetical protein